MDARKKNKKKETNIGADANIYSNTQISIAVEPFSPNMNVSEKTFFRNLGRNWKHNLQIYKSLRGAWREDRKKRTFSNILFLKGVPLNTINDLQGRRYFDNNSTKLLFYFPLYEYLFPIFTASGEITR